MSSPSDAITQPSGPQPQQPFGCGTNPGQPPCPPQPAAIALAAAKDARSAPNLTLYTYNEMLAHGAECYAKGVADCSAIDRKEAALAGLTDNAA